jgi:hypothetical protein
MIQIDAGDVERVSLRVNIAIGRARLPRVGRRKSCKWVKVKVRARVRVGVGVGVGIRDSD